MKLLESIRRRRVAKWARVAGSTYAEWLVDLEFAHARDAGVMLAIAAPLAATGMFITATVPGAFIVGLWVWPLVGLSLVIVWAVLSRRHGNVSLRIADDLWRRGFAVAVPPPVYREPDFQLWVKRNRIRPDQLEAAAKSPVVRDPPQRNVRPRPFVVKLACMAGALGVILLFVAAPWQFSRAAIFLVAPITFGLVVECLILYFAAGSRRMRSIASWQLPIVALGVAGAVVIAPERAWIDIFSGAAIGACVGMLWTARATEYISATEAVNRALALGAAERIRTTPN